MRRIFVAALLAAACSRDATPVRARPCLAALADLRYAVPDPLLMAARTAIAGGTLDPELRAALLASTDPAHARAQRILLAMDTRAATLPIDETPDEPPPPRAPMLRVATPPPEPIVASTAAPLAPGSPPVALPPPRPIAKLNTVGLSRTRKGAALTLTGSGGLVVGIANQPLSGVVHLVMEAEAGQSALRARPRIEGARVTGVRKTGKSVFVTLSLEPGWRLGGIVRSGSGATVNLRRPA